MKEQASSVGQRDGLAAVLDFVREGGTLVISRLDRLARSTADLLGIVATLEAKSVALRILDFGGSEVETRSPTRQMLLTMFAAVAELERAIMLERQRVGGTWARAEGKYKGRAPTAHRKGRRVWAVHAEGLGTSAIAAAVGISRASVFRVLADALA
ncbi:recombinase family protein [Sphingobium yanoikuyae]|uniref:recombinase family protein n=1 Tax=Sphingobium yanoikuyae TaxID=13690 RepID=UPI0028990CDC|nr:recombinase family protein [Sphingobium yanoikuyae]